MSKPVCPQDPPCVIEWVRDLDPAHASIAAVLVVLGHRLDRRSTSHVALDAAHSATCPGCKKPCNPLPLMADLEKWNYLIGFGLIFLGPDRRRPQDHPAGPRPRRRDRDARLLPDRPDLDRVFYFVGQDSPIPVMNDLGQYNLLVGIGFMAVGFTFATKWE